MVQRYRSQSSTLGGAVVDYVGVYLEALRPLWWFIPVLAILLFLGSPVGKGFVGELSVRLAASFQLDGKAYHRFHNVTLPTPDGTTQIDHVIVSRYGIFVIETKNMKGWIFGKEQDAQWTQSIHGKKRRFQNPLRQNYKHVRALQTALQVPVETLHSVIAFVGDAHLKSDMPRNVTSGGGFIAHVKSFREAVFSDTEVGSLVERLKTGRLALASQPTGSTSNG